MNKLTMLILLLCCETAEAQHLSIGVKAGASIPDLTAGSREQTPLNTGYSSRLGTTAGIFAELTCTHIFSIKPGIEYAAQGGKKNGMQALSTPDGLAAMYPPGQAPQYLYANFKSEARLNYLMIPVLATFSSKLSGSSFRLYAGAGPFVSLLLSAKQVTSGESQLYVDPEGKQPLPGGLQPFDNTENIRKQLHKGNLGIEGNIGASYHLARSYAFVEGGGNYGFLNIQKDKRDGKNNTGAATIVIGYSYSL